ncbi:OsmC family protein [Enterococcus casseliflavus]|uniref:OsmC family protein n=1 Tax=Enterococcus casseliflavus TaxID=37734 RepID=UPI0039A64CA7
MTIKTFSADVKLISGLKVSGQSREFEIIIDEPRTTGGTNTGMNPVEVLLNSLGACLVIAAKTFARSKKIILKSISVEVAGELDPDGFMGENPNAKKGFSKIITTFHIDADNTQEEIEDYIAFVNSICPVHDTIAHAPEFESKIVIK